MSCNDARVYHAWNEVNLPTVSACVTVTVTVKLSTAALFGNSLGSKHGTLSVVRINTTCTPSQDHVRFLTTENVVVDEQCKIFKSKLVYPPAADRSTQHDGVTSGSDRRNGGKMDPWYVSLARIDPYIITDSMGMLRKQLDFLKVGPQKWQDGH
jgi:hypothetical protein